MDVPVDLSRVLFVCTGTPSCLLTSILYLHGSSQYPRYNPGTAPRPHGSHRSIGLRLGRKVNDCREIPRPPGKGSFWSQRRRRPAGPCLRRSTYQVLLPRERSAESQETHRQDLPQSVVEER